MTGDVPVLWVPSLLLAHDAHTGNVVVCAGEQHGSRRATGSSRVV